MLLPPNIADPLRGNLSPSGVKPPTVLWTSISGCPTGTPTSTLVYSEVGGSSSPSTGCCYRHRRQVTVPSDGKASVADNERHHHFALRAACRSSLLPCGRRVGSGFPGRGPASPPGRGGLACLAFDGGGNASGGYNLQLTGKSAPLPMRDQTCLAFPTAQTFGPENANRRAPIYGAIIRACSSLRIPYPLASPRERRCR